MATFTTNQLTAIKGTNYGGSIWKVPGFTKNSIRSTVKKIVALLKTKGYDVDVDVAGTESTYIEAVDINDNIVEIRVSDHFKRDEYVLMNLPNALGEKVSTKVFEDGIESDDDGYFHASINSQEAAKEVLSGLTAF